MVNPNFIFMRAMNSSLWIAVMIVHVGCIIEAQPSKSPSSSSSSLSSLASGSLINEKRSHYSTFELVPAASISASYSNSNRNRQNNFDRSKLVQRTYRRGQKFTTSTMSSAPTAITSLSSTTEAYDDDSCTGKLDGYYQNFGSSCTSYYFCAAGYQITYVCPQGEKFTGTKCDEEYECPLKNGHVNLCADVPNGYYSNIKTPGKYFYCFQRAKVIDLQCDLGKVFIEGECTFPKDNGQTKDSNFKQTTTTTLSEQDNDSCMRKSNGFYTDKQNGCRKYYYCINGDKTELSCQSGFLFNGDICVHNSRFNCPYLLSSTSTASITSTTESLRINNDISSRGRSSSKNDVDLNTTTDRSSTEITTTTAESIKTG